MGDHCGLAGESAAISRTDKAATYRFFPRLRAHKHNATTARKPAKSLVDLVRMADKLGVRRARAAPEKRRLTSLSPLLLAVCGLCGRLDGAEMAFQASRKPNQ
jgi:hypothetical protein